MAWTIARTTGRLSPAGLQSPVPHEEKLACGMAVCERLLAVLVTEQGTESVQLDLGRSLPSAEWFFRCTASTSEDCAMGKSRCVR